MFWVSHNPYLVEIPLCSPHGVSVIEVESWLSILHFNLSYRTVVFRIGTIDIAGNATTQDGMIQSCVEFYLVVFVLCFYCDATQMFVPSVVRLLLGFIKSHVFRFCLQIQARILYRSVGDTHFHGNLFLSGSLESKVRTRTESISSQ